MLKQQTARDANPSFRTIELLRKHREKSRLGEVVPEVMMIIIISTGQQSWLNVHSLGTFAPMVRIA